MLFPYCFVALAIAASTPVWAADVIRCPSKIEVTQRLAVQVPGWSVSSDGMPHQLAGLTFFDDNPAEKASLVPDKQAHSGGKTVASWRFPASVRPTWVACRYTGTDIVLTRELPKSVRTCAITYSTRESIEGSPVIEKIDCQ
jgi:hypothetical protein